MTYILARGGSNYTLHLAGRVVAGRRGEMIRTTVGYFYFCLTIVGRNVSVRLYSKTRVACGAQTGFHHGREITATCKWSGLQALEKLGPAPEDSAEMTLLYLFCRRAVPVQICHAEKTLHSSHFHHVTHEGVCAMNARGWISSAP